MFLLRSRPVVEETFYYVIAIAAERFDIEVHSLIVMSNHWHAKVTDTMGKLPAFLHYVHEFVAKILNCSMGRYENFWSSEKTSIVALEGEVDVIDKLAYLMANPVAAGLVESGDQWPGIRRMWDPKQPQVTVQRPKIFYRAEGKMPPAATLTFTRPPVFAKLDDHEASKAMKKIVAKRERQERKRLGNAKVLGVRGILRQKLTSSPKTSAKRFGINPRVGAKNKWARIEALQRLKSWLVAYRDAWEEWRGGNREVVFPAGTYALRRFAGVACAS